MKKAMFYNLLKCRYNYICELRDVSYRLYDAFSRGDMYSSALILESRADIFMKLDELMQNIKMEGFPSVLDLDSIEPYIRHEEDILNDKIIDILIKSRNLLEILEKRDELIRRNGLKRNSYNGK